MKVDTENLKIEIGKCNQKIEQYEKCLYNIYNTLNQASSCWQDNHAERFLSNLSYEKRNIDLMIGQLKSTVDIYEYIVKEYEKIGTNVKCNFASKEDVSNCFDIVLSGLRNIVTKYEKINFSHFREENNLMLSEKSSIENICSVVEPLKNDVISKFEEVESIENEVRLKISKANNYILKDNDILENI